MQNFISCYMTKQGLNWNIFVLTNRIFVTDFWKGLNRSVIWPISADDIVYKTNIIVYFQ